MLKLHVINKDEWFDENFSMMHNILEALFAQTLRHFTQITFVVKNIK